MFPLALLSNPTVILAAVLALFTSYGVVGYKAYHMGIDHCVAETSKLVDVEVRTRDAATAAASEAIAGLKIEHQTIRQKTEVVTREVPVYRDCRHTDGAMRLLNDALAPPDQRGGPGASGDQLPGSDPARR